MFLRIVLTTNRFFIMELQGKIIVFLPAVRLTSRRTGEPFVKYGFVIEFTQSSFTRKAVMYVVGEERWKKMSLQLGSEYTVQFDVDAREYNGRWYNELTAWNAVRNGAAGQQAQQTPQQPKLPIPEVPTGQQQDNGSQLPF